MLLATSFWLQSLLVLRTKKSEPVFLSSDSSLDCVVSDFVLAPKLMGPPDKKKINPFSCPEGGLLYDPGSELKGGSRKQKRQGNKL